MSEPVTARTYSGEDWYGDELADAVYERCAFSDVDLTEATLRQTRLDLPGGDHLAEVYGAVVEP